MRNYDRFYNKIEVSMVILVIKDLICLVGDSSKTLMKNDMFDFNVLKCFGINTRTDKVSSTFLFLLDGSFLHQAWLKLTLRGMLGDILVLLLVEVFFVGVWRDLFELFLRFLKFRLL